jgi:1D-myo-inositol-triphosphate 3-kinase
MSHAFIRTSILLIYSDETGEATVNMIDLSRAYSAGRRLTHTDAWAPGNHEDGYLTGMDNLIKVFENLIAHVGGEATGAATGTAGSGVAPPTAAVPDNGAL